jgi:hypothetical protein
MKGKGRHANSLANALTAFAEERQGARVLIDGATRKNYIALRNAIKRNALPYRVESTPLGVWLVPARESETPVIKISADGTPEYDRALSASERRAVMAERLAQEWRGMLRGTRRIYRAPSKRHIASRGKAWHMRKYGKALAAYRAANDETNAARMADGLAAFERLSIMRIGRVWDDIGALDSCLIETPERGAAGIRRVADTNALLAYFEHEYGMKRAASTFDYGAFIMRATKAQHETRQCSWTMADLKERRGLAAHIAPRFVAETPDSVKATWSHPADKRITPLSWPTVPRDMRVRALLAAVYDARETLIAERDRMSAHIKAYGAPLTPDGNARVRGPFERAQRRFKACIAAYDAARLETR